MDILIGANRQGWRETSFVALIDEKTTVRARSFQELAQHLYALGARDELLRFSPPEDGDHALSLKQCEDFQSAWKAILIAGEKQATE